MADVANLLAKLEELKIEHTDYTHAAAMTCEAHAEALKGLTDAALTKNLFLKDKKSRFYVLTALTSTKVNLNILSARFGLGRGGLRMAPDELVETILGVPLGSVTPLCIAQTSAANVVLLLDSTIKSQDQIVVHPLVNTTSTVLTPAGLESFITSIPGRQVIYVDLSLDPKIDRENPPDLRGIAEAATPIKLGDEEESAGTKQQQQQTSSAGSKPSTKSTDTKKAAAGKGKKEGISSSAPRKDDIYAMGDTILDLVLGPEGVKAVAADRLRQLKADLAMELNALRNVAYASGFKAAQKTIAATISGEFA